MRSGVYIPVIIAIVLLVVAVWNVIMSKKGYRIPGKTVVRCSKGHLFWTTWIEGGSLKAVRLGPFTRYQHCPVGKHWAIVHPVGENDLTGNDRKVLAQQR